MINYRNPVKIFLSKILWAVRVFNKKIFSKPNIHLESSTSKQKIIRGVPIFLRPSSSDQARLREFRQDIYSGDKKFLRYLNDNIKPTVLFDFGANIGLSSLALCNSIPSVQKIISVEAEKENYGVLKKNCNIWNEVFDKSFIPVQGIISGNENFMNQVENLQEGYSASGTFVYKKVDGCINESMKSITPHNLLKKFDIGNQVIICKIDIEGGEYELFEGDTSWLENVAYLSIEIHDRFSVNSIKSSINFLKALLKYDFAIVPSQDTLFCYNRKYKFYN
jgi:FkbM family methyltransferase